MESTIPGIEDLIVRGSRHAPQDASGPDPAARREFRPPSENEKAQFHAEENLVNELRERIEALIEQGTLTRQQLAGQTVRIAVDQGICQTCLSGVAQSEHAGVLLQFSRRYQELRIEIVDIRTGDFTIFEGGNRTVNHRRGAAIPTGQH
jgi:hypothetical protein